jgi:dihydrofolate reductase
MPTSRIGLVWARSTTGVIGADGDMPWHLPEDLAHFRQVTGGSTVVMGRRTWESIPERFRPLPGRRNIVLTRDETWHAEGADVVHDLAAALDTGMDSDEQLWIMGGGQVYAAAMPFADRIAETQIDVDVAGDTVAPEIGPEWEAAAEPWQESRTGLRYRFVTWTRS